MDNKFIKKFLKGSAFSSIGTLVTIVVHFLSLKVLASIPQIDYGTYTFIIVISHGFQILSGLGLNLTLVKHLSGDIASIDKKVVSSVFLARITQIALISLIVYSVGHLFLGRLTDEKILPFIIFIPVIFGLASIRDLLFHLLQGLQRFNQYAYINIFSALVRLGTILVFFYMDQLTIPNLIWVEVITYGTSLLVLLVYAPLSQIFTFRVDGAAFRQIFSFGLPLYANDVLTYIYNRVNVLLVGGLLTYESVASYDMSGKIPDGFGRLFSSLIVVFFPSISELLNEGKKAEAQKFMNRGLVLASACLSFAALGVFLFRDEVILIIASEQYLNVSFALALMMINFNLNSIARMMGYTIVAAGYTTVPVRINLVSSIANIIGCLILIPRFGYVGAIYSLLCMNVLSQIMNYYFLLKAGLKPAVLGFSKSTIFLVLLIVGYTVLGNESYWLRGVAVLIYMGMCWFLIPEIKPSVRYGMNVLRIGRWLPFGAK